MFMMILTAFLVVITSYLYLRWRQLRQYWAKRGVAYLPPHPLLGSLTFLQRENPAIWFRRMYNTCKKPYMGIWLFWRPALMVNTPEIARNILMKDSALFRNRLVSSGSSDPIGKLNIFSLDDPLWSQIRRRLTVFFTGSKLRGLQNLITTKCNQLVQRIEKERQNSKFIDMRMLFTDYTTDVIGTASFGVECDATLTGESALRSITKDFMKFSLYRGICWCSAFFFPEMVDVFRFSVFPKQATEYLRKIFRTIVDQRGGFEKKVTEPKDLLDILIKIKTF